ncbi:HipA domain-containing protein [Aquimarina sp. U1-2]|uniref:HipA domain-containing protein n=1 Tax=Aquimarina sp. U1-2 TaxID=2823141 RepID=UPI0035303F5B
MKDSKDFHEHCAKTFFGTTEVPLLDYTLDQMSELAKNVVERSISVPGVQAKLSMSLVNEVTNNHHNRLTVVGALGGDFIFKPPNDNYPEMPENEHVTMRIAEAFGINTVPSTLIRLKSGELSYLTKRIDRELDGTKIHMLDMFQITEAFDKYRSSMERIGKSLGMYASNTLLDKLYFFEITLFSFLTGNNDMHLKNFSMIQANSGWSLAPAYDLLNVAIVNPDDTEELALTLAGKKKKFTKAHFEEFGQSLGLTSKQIEGVFKRFRKHQKKAAIWIENSFLSNDLKPNYLSVLEERYDRIYANR